jgi:hypothetical protein
MKTEILNIRKMVAECLEEDERCRNNDNWLVIRVHQKMGLLTNITHGLMRHTQPFETITRIRRKFNEEGKYLPEPETQEKRKEEQEEFKNINKWWEE